MSKIEWILFKKEELSMLKEFKEFISRGNALDLAVGVIIGGAFSAIVNSLVDDLLMPIIGMMVGIDFSSWVIRVNTVPLAIGLFIQAIVNFLIIAFVLFLIIRTINKTRKPEPEVEVVEEVVESDEVVLLREIRDALRK